MSQEQRGSLDGHDAVLCFGGMDWWYHNRGYLVVQVLKYFTHLAPVLYVNSFGLRMPSVMEGRTFAKRVVRKSLSVTHRTTCVDHNFWVASPLSLPFWQRPRLAKLNVAILTLQVQAACRKVGLRHPLIWVHGPTSYEVVKKLRGDSFLIYQRTDKYEEYSDTARKYVESANRWLIENADLIIYSGSALYEEEKCHGRPSLVVNHAVDTSLFDPDKAKATECPRDLRTIPRPIAGFIGEVDEDKVDMKLVAAAARALPTVSFVFLGQVTANLAPIAGLSNIHLLGKKPYPLVPQYGARFDVALMPWKKSRWVHYLSPIKLKEYLALGLPIVSMEFPEALHYSQLIFLARDPLDFIRGIEQALNGEAVGTPSSRREKVAGDTWENAAFRILDEIRKHEQRLSA